MPFFVKAPGQIEGRAWTTSVVRNIDMLATVADLLGTRGLLRAGRALGVLARACARATRSRCARATSPAWCASGCAELRARRAARRREHAELVRHRRGERAAVRRPVGAAPTGSARTPSCSAGRCPARAVARRGSPGARDGRRTLDAVRARLAARAGPADARDRLAVRACRPASTATSRSRSTAASARRRGASTSTGGEPEYYSFELPETALRPGRNRLRDRRRSPSAAGCARGSGPP